MKGYESYHPALLFLGYGLALVFSMISLHPFVIAASLTGSFLLFLAMFGWKKFFSELLFCLGIFVLLSLANPLFVHDGETLLFFLNDNPVTLESMIYGGMSSLMIISVLLWCKCYGSILTTDKFLYLFGKTIPKLGLILSMTFRFIPLFKLQIRKISQTQKTMGLYPSDGITDKMRSGMRVFDSLVAWSMENSIDTADAMKARGYGHPGRTSFSLFRFRTRDGILLAVFGGLAAAIFTCFSAGGYSFFYYPYVMKLVIGWKEGISAVMILVFFCIPGIIELEEKRKWSY